MARGVHKDRCDFNRVRLRRLLRHNEIDRSHIEEQLRNRTSLSPVRRSAAVLPLFGPRALWRGKLLIWSPQDFLKLPWKARNVV